MMSYIGFCCCDEHHDQKPIGEERFYLAYPSILLFIMGGHQDRAGTRSQKLMQRLWRGAAYWPAQLAQLAY